MYARYMRCGREAAPARNQQPNVQLLPDRNQGLLPVDGAGATRDREPLAHIEGLNVKVDRRHDRRALTVAECRRLIDAAMNGEPVRKMPGPDRAVLYRVALETGLRWNELRNLTVSSFQLDGEKPTVTVAAAYSKHRREDVLPFASSWRSCYTAISA